MEGNWSSHVGHSLSSLEMMKRGPVCCKDSKCYTQVCSTGFILIFCSSDSTWLKACVDIGGIFEGSFCVCRVCECVWAKNRCYWSHSSSDCLLSLPDVKASRFPSNASCALIHIITVKFFKVGFSLDASRDLFPNLKMNLHAEWCMQQTGLPHSCALCKHEFCMTWVICMLTFWHFELIFDFCMEAVFVFSGAGCSQMHIIIKNKK